MLKRSKVGTHVEESDLGVIFAVTQQGKVAGAIDDLEGGWNLSVSEAVECEVSVLSDGVGVVDAEHSLTHHHSALLVHECFRVVAHDVVEACEEAVAGGNLGVHGTVHVVEEVQCFVDQLVAIAKQALLDLRLTTREHVVRV